jgi:hypothetical protein
MEILHHENLFHHDPSFRKLIENFVSDLYVMRSLACPEVFRVIFVRKGQEIIFFAFGVFYPDLPVDIEFDFVLHIK